MENRAERLLNPVGGHLCEELFDVELLMLEHRAVDLALVQDTFLFVVDNAEFVKELVKGVRPSDVDESVIAVTREVIILQQRFIKLLNHLMLILEGHSDAVNLVIN